MMINGVLNTKWSIQYMTTENFKAHEDILQEQPFCSPYSANKFKHWKKIGNSIADNQLLVANFFPLLYATDKSWWWNES